MRRPARRLPVDRCWRRSRQRLSCRSRMHLRVVSPQCGTRTCRAEGESLISGRRSNCVPMAGAPSDLAWHLRSMAVPEAWNLSSEAHRYGKNVLIGHVDTGVAEHEEFKPASQSPGRTTFTGMAESSWERGRDLVDVEPGGYDPLPNAFMRNSGEQGTTTTASVIVSRGTVVQQPSAGLTCGGTAGAGKTTGVAPAANLVPVARRCPWRDAKIMWPRASIPQGPGRPGHRDFVHLATRR